MTRRRRPLPYWAHIALLVMGLVVMPDGPWWREFVALVLFGLAYSGGI